MKKRILVASTYETNDTTSFLRAKGPLSLMRDEVEIVDKPLTNQSDWFKDWSHWYGIDICYLHRACSPWFTMLSHYAKLHDVPTWVDHDDDLMAIPSDNPVYAHYSFPEAREAIEESYRSADVLTCSGELMYDSFLKDYGRNSSNTFLITTGLDDRLLKFQKNWSKNNRVGWRGSKSHLTDLLLFQSDLSSLMHENVDRDYYFWGINPYFLNWDNKVRVRWVDQMNLYPFLMAMTHQNCSVHMVPLMDHRFNRVKSNLSWLDASLAGSAVVGPDFEHFRKPGIIQYGDSFKDTMHSVLRGEFDLEKQWLDSWGYIKDNLLQSKLNLKRYEIIRNL